MANPTATVLTAPAHAAHLWLTARVGQVVHTSEWLTVTQQRIQAFADATGDHQWIHIDVERARRESPYKSTIAHGYLTLSLYPLLRGLVDAKRPMLDGMTNVINYGLNKTRFPAALLADANVRARCTLLGVEIISPNALQLTENIALEVENQTKPSCVAEAIMRVGF